MVPDPLSFPSIPGEPSPALRPSDRTAGGTAFADLYSEAIEAANQEMSQMLSAESPDSGSDVSGDDPLSILELQSAASALSAFGPVASASDDYPVVHGELMRQVAALRFVQFPMAPAAGMVGERPAFSAGDAAVPSTTPAELPTERASGVSRLISWIDAHAHLHSSHHCAASVRRAIEAAGIQTDDRPSSGDAGDYGPFLLRHGAQVVSAGSYEPKAGDIAVFDRTQDHPAGHIQVFDGQHWVSDFVQHSFSPFRDQQSTPPVTVYRLS